MYRFRLLRSHGSPFDPRHPGARLNWRQGDTIPLTTERTLRVLAVRDDDGDEPPRWVVDDLPGGASSAA
jgi:hypothetical protein